MDVEPQPLLEQLIWDQQAVRTDDDGGCVEVEPGRWPLGLEHRDAQSLGNLLGGCRLLVAAAAASRVGPRQERRNLVAISKPFEHVGPERRRRGDRDPRHDSDYREAMRSRGRSCAIASLRDDSSVRSMISTPSR